MTPVAEPLEYVEGPGPGIAELPEQTEGDLQQGAEELRGGAQPEYPGWQLDHVETFLMGLGSGIHMLIGQSEHDWEMTRADLERIAPPMMRIANRWQPALRASVYADPFMVAYGFALYGWRSALERARAIKDREAALEGAPAAGYARPGDDNLDVEVDAGEQPTEEFQAVEPMFPSAAVPRIRRP
jgi:hypothetical protein